MRRIGLVCVVKIGLGGCTPLLLSLKLNFSDKAYTSVEY